ncbi:methylthioribose-1-phosphate isomerase isoform X2 [Phalaenopsis equestris]|uniref:methylthioribose-1-phosphate isomerase isoform X2 n=1 Tax=Phalaenopsis equestris TaxID=78828 RepID=UPI0009E313DA|nr:methylthioribose-1-phosphate isomerase isoform X2 [Phalaenopsis equestris]
MADQFSPLQSICYERGLLRLLDQRKLPLETVYLDILNAADGWNAIRDMVVRGAPAIAISAALSLAVEIFNLDFSGTSLEAASFLVKKLDYLVSSRPTAVNLSDAATKLQNLVLKTVETTDEAKLVFQTYITAAERMLIDDVNTNKAIGFHGANDIQSNLKGSKTVSILTHCNTGSLATAGYGTALGVIRALHANGFLETAFCTETRPFNQGSRLTAFELVHDKIHATLIADSAAASLMKVRTIGAVVVGADRIAANAPVTSIDLSLRSGDQIVIEERSPKELLCSDGGLGKQVAASGIGVWNPAFDVTPAYLITAIITEKGVIRKALADDFDIKGFLQNAASGNEG